MMINTDNLVSITDANQNFSRVARMVDENGAAIILKNNVPRYILMEFNQLEEEQLAGDEDIQDISKRLMAKNRHAYEVLAKWEGWAVNRCWSCMMHCRRSLGYCGNQRSRTSGLCIEYTIRYVWREIPVSFFASKSSSVGIWSGQ